MEREIQLILDSPYVTDKKMRQAIRSRIEKILAWKGICGIILLPRSMEVPAIDRDAQELCVAIGIAGWTAWTIADSIRDNDPACDRSIELPIFSTLSSIMYGMIYDANLSGEDLGGIAHIIGKMESANMQHDNDSYSLDDSVWKSMGAAIPLLILLMLAGASKEITMPCERYFYHLIAARQISDDVFDWRQDLQEGRDTLVTKWLKKETGIEGGTYLFEKAFEHSVSKKAAYIISAHARSAFDLAAELNGAISLPELIDLPKYYKEMADKELA